MRLCKTVAEVLRVPLLFIYAVLPDTCWPQHDTGPETCPDRPGGVAVLHDARLGLQIDQLRSSVASAERAGQDSVCAFRLHNEPKMLRTLELKLICYLLLASIWTWIPRRTLRSTWFLVCRAGDCIWWRSLPTPYPRLVVNSNCNSVVESFCRELLCCRRILGDGIFSAKTSITPKFSITFFLANFLDFEKSSIYFLGLSKFQKSFRNDWFLFLYKFFEFLFLRIWEMPSILELSTSPGILKRLIDVSLFCSMYALDRSCKAFFIGLLLYWIHNLVSPYVYWGSLTTISALSWNTHILYL